MRSLCCLKFCFGHSIATLRVNCKKHRHFRLGLQVPHIYEIVSKSTNFLQKTLVACLDCFKCVYDKGGPFMTRGARIRRRVSTVHTATPLDGVTRRWRTGSSRAGGVKHPEAMQAPPPALTLSCPSPSLCSRSFAAAVPSHISDRRVAMVSWSDDDSSKNSHKYADSASDEGIIKTMDNSDFEGTKPDALCNELPASREACCFPGHPYWQEVPCLCCEGGKKLWAS